MLTGQLGFTRPSSIYFSLGIVRDIVPLFIICEVHRKASYKLRDKGFFPRRNSNFKSERAIICVIKIDCSILPFLKQPCVRKVHESSQ